MNDNLKEQIKRVARAVRIVYTDMPETFTSIEFCNAVRGVMGDGYVMDQTIMRRLRDFFSNDYRYDKKEKVFTKISTVEKLASAA